MYIVKYNNYKYSLIYFCKSQTRKYLIENQRSFVLLILLSILTGIYLFLFFNIVATSFHSSQAISVAENHLIIPIFIYIFWYIKSDFWFIIVYVFCISFCSIESCIVFDNLFHFLLHRSILLHVDLFFSFRIKIFL